MPHITINSAVKELQTGRMVILADDPEPESSGDLVMAAEHITAESINFMAAHGRGLICLPMTGERIDTLELNPMVDANTLPAKTGFTVSIEARQGVTTGISAADRAHTIRTAVAPDAQPHDLVRPGHIFPLRSRDGGVIVRAGHTEGAVDLARAAGLAPAGAICAILDEAGNTAGMEYLEQFSHTHGIGICTITDLIEFRMARESFVHRLAETQVPTVYGGEFKFIVYANDVDSFQHIALVKGTIDSSQPILTRVHSECFTGDILGSLRCDCGDQLHTAMQMIAAQGMGIVLYVRQEGRGIGLVNKLKAYNLQDEGFDTVEANHELGFKSDLRHYGIGAQVLVELGVRKIRLLTNNPKKLIGLEGYGLEVVEQIPIEIAPNPHNRCYLECKKLKMGHKLNLDCNP